LARFESMLVIKIVAGSLFVCAKAGGPRLFITEDHEILSPAEAGGVFVEKEDDSG
jgi:hypothetical protein